MASKPPDAFLSYTRFDDQHEGGAISEFRNRLASAVRAVTGEPFEIFQDVDGIGLGEHWPSRLDQLLEEARFFIPILTPNYFRSKACRDELEKFLKAEKDRGRNDLVLPIYYIRCRVLEDHALREGDALAAAIHERQREDWRGRRFLPFADPKVRRSLEALAERIDDARKRAAEAAAADPAEELVRGQAEEAQAKRRSEQKRQRAPDARARRRADEEVRRRPTATGTTVSPPARSLELRYAKEPCKPTETSMTPGRVFRDIGAFWCPEMVVISPGEFAMGSTEAKRQWATEQGAEAEWVEAEKPQHLVRIAYSLAVGRFPVTFGEYGHFADSTGRQQPRDEGWGRNRRPVIDVDWEGARAFVAWLSVQTGQLYRLLSEAEWEYACRAGTATRYWWGDDITPENANYGESVGKTTEVSKYRANPWGLYDTHGNVWEWIEDCWNDGYEGAPEDGSAWTSGDCGRRVLRGGSYWNAPGLLRSACRMFGGGIRFRSVSSSGFRVARTFAGQSSVRDAHWNKLEYHDPALAGLVTFNYSNNDGRYSIGRDEFFFETKWSKASDRSIYLLNDPSSIVGVAEAPEIRSHEDIGDPANYDMSSRVRTIQKGEHAILKNRHDKYAVLKVLNIKDRIRSDNVDELTFEFWILTDMS
jgi:formylglycine-generating enzyme required for sulfatase activity